MEHILKVNLSPSPQFSYNMEQRTSDIVTVGALRIKKSKASPN